MKFFWPVSSWISQDSQRASGGLALIWNASKFSSTLLNSFYNSIITTFHDLSIGWSWDIVNVYAPNNRG